VLRPAPWEWLGRRTKSPDSKENRMYNLVPRMGSNRELACKTAASLIGAVIVESAVD
jgi:hypothetical protein